jgi:hypothetical protein
LALADDRRGVGGGRCAGAGIVTLTRTMAIDLAYQIRAGHDMLASHAVASTDTFTFTQAGQPWLNQQWGAQVLLAAIHGAGGWAGILLLRGALVFAIVLLLYRACRERGASPRTAALLTVAGWLTGIEIVDQLRPQQFAFVLFMVCVWLLARRDRHPRGVWLVPVAVIPWANLHGSFPLVFVLLLFAWLEDRRRAPSLARIEVLAGSVALVASFANPFGVRVWSYVWDLSTHPVVSHQVAEWGPPSVHSWTGRFFFVTLLGVAAYLARRRPPWTGGRCLELAFFAVLGLLAIRGRVVGLYWPVVIAGLVQERERGRRGSLADQRDRDRVPRRLTAVATTVHLGTDPVTRGPDVLSYAPTDHRRGRSERPCGSHAFVDELYASWSEYLAPASGGCRSEDRDLPKETWDDYLLVSQGRDGWQEVLDRWDVRVLVLHPDQSTGLLSVIDDDPRWSPVLKTDHGSVYERVYLRS